MPQFPNTARIERQVRDPIAVDIVVAPGLTSQRNSSALSVSMVMPMKSNNWLAPLAVSPTIAKVKDAIVHYGLTAADLGLSKAAGSVGKSPAAVGSKPMKKVRKNAAAKPAAKAVKFKDDQGHTWGGIGKRPDWFKAALAAGKTPEDLLAKG